MAAFANVNNTTLYQAIQATAPARPFSFVHKYSNLHFQTETGQKHGKTAKFAEIGVFPVLSKRGKGDENLRDSQKVGIPYKVFYFSG